MEGCDAQVDSLGLCLGHYIKARDPKVVAAKNAEQTMRKGGHLTNQRRSPFNVLARSCPGCGNLLSTPPERIVKANGSPVPACPKCRVQQVMAHQRRRMLTDEDFARKQRARTEQVRRRVQESTVAAARNSRKEWTGPELELADRSDLSAQEVARMIGRSYYAVKHVRRRLKDHPRDQILAGRDPAIRARPWPSTRRS